MSRYLLRLVIAVAASSTLLFAFVQPVQSARDFESNQSADDQRARVMCGGKRATIVGTKGRDILKGTKRRDVIHGKGANDVIAGLGRRDKVCGGGGHDTLDGNKGRDRLWGGKGNDYCIGERREHRNNHKSCEVHAPVPNPPPPPAPRSQQAETLERATAPARAFPGDSWFSYGDPWCGNGDGTIRLNNLTILGDYTDPSYVYVQTWMFYKNDRTGLFDLGRPHILDHGYYTLPNDNFTYTFDGGVWNLRRPSQSVGVHVVWWWDGSQWVDESYYALVGFHNAVTFMGVCIT